VPEVLGSPTVDDTRDLVSRAEIHDLVVEFYRQVVFDDLLAPIFGEVAEVDWSQHIPRLIDYWCRILLRDGSYAGAVTAAHRNLHALEPVRTEHCDRWYELWVNSVDARWAGPVAGRAKAHAASLMAGMSKHVFGFEWTPPPR
jgi:hemoglobin